MRGQAVYLDSSAIVKRYIKEPGSDEVRSTFQKAYAGENHVSYSIWNIGEVLVVLDKAKTLGRISPPDYELARKRFLSETRRMTRLTITLLVPVKTMILREAWRLLEKHHIYVADALQLASAQHVNAGEFITADKKLHHTAQTIGLNSTYLPQHNP